MIALASLPIYSVIQSKVKKIKPPFTHFEVCDDAHFVHAVH